MNLVATTEFRLTAGWRQQALADWLHLAEKIAKHEPRLDAEQLAAAAREELAAAWRQSLAHQAGIEWRERRLLEHEIEASEITFGDVPQFLADLHQLLLAYRLEAHASGWRAVRCSRRRRAHGVFYTPPPVADYIVRRTLGPLMKAADARRQAARPISVLDPACGAGSFLLAALEHLTNWYAAAGVKIAPAEIARRHLFGVDVDPAALRLCRFNLAWATGSVEAVANLRFGDALLGPDFRTPDDETPDAAEIIDWPRFFPDVYRRGGFDYIVANPPYRRELDHGKPLSTAVHPTLEPYRTPRMISTAWQSFLAWPAVTRSSSLPAGMLGQ